MIPQQADKKAQCRIICAVVGAILAIATAVWLGFVPAESYGKIDRVGSLFGLFYAALLGGGIGYAVGDALAKELYKD